jgi:hypothetical protein
MRQVLGFLSVTAIFSYARNHNSNATRMQSPGTAGHAKRKWQKHEAKI